MSSFFESNTPHDYAIRMKRLILPHKGSSTVKGSKNYKKEKSPWFLVQTNRGNLYFYNKQTGESLWEPQDPGLQNLINELTMQQVMGFLDFNNYKIEEDSEDEGYNYPTPHADNTVTTTHILTEAVDDFDEFETDLGHYGNADVDGVNTTLGELDGAKAASLNSIGPSEEVLQNLTENETPKVFPSAQALKAAFLELLAEFNITAFSMFELERLKFSQDPRYTGLSHDQAKKYFDLYLKSISKRK